MAKIEESNVNIFEKKSLLMLDTLIYPKSLYSILKDYSKIEAFSLITNFGKDCVRVFVISDTDVKRLDDTCDTIKHSFIDALKSIRMIHMDVDELKENIQQVKKQIENGISEDTFYDWFMRVAFLMAHNNLPTEDEVSFRIREGFLPGATTVGRVCKNDEGIPDLYINYVFFSSNGLLLKKPTIEVLVKKAEKMMQEKVKNKMGPSKKVAKRNPLGSRLRHECFKRDNYLCKDCGATKEESTLHCDHILPVAQGGTDELSNLQTLCANCNLAKSDKKWIAGESK